MKAIYYFGCVGRSGHFLGESKNGHIVSAQYLSDVFTQRFGNSGQRLDGLFCPPTNWRDQLAMESRVGPWCIVSWHDHSVDSRGGSHSTFVGIGYDSGVALLADAKERFKEVFARQPEVTINTNLTL